MKAINLVMSIGLVVPFSQAKTVRPKSQVHVANNLKSTDHTGGFTEEICRNGRNSGKGRCPLCGHKVQILVAETRVPRHKTT
jgi:hypothetical protein